MTQLTNTFEGGTDTVALTTGNTGGISGTAFDSIVAAGGNLAVFSTIQARSTLSCRLQNNAAGNSSLSWTTAYADIIEDYGRIYLYMEDWPRAGFSHWFTQFATSAGVNQGGIQILDNGKLRLFDAIAPASTDITSALATDTWWRIEWKWTCQVGGVTPGSLTVRVYPDDSTTLNQAETTRALSVSGSTVIGTRHLGILLAATDMPTASGSYFIDNIVTGATTWPGPAVVATPFARPTADVSDGAWLTQAGGTSLFSVIDETVADDADFIVSGPSPSGADECKIELGALTDPGVGTGHTIRYRYMKDAAAGDQINLTVNLYRADGTTLVRANTHTDIPATVTPGQFTLTTTEADSIPTGDYASGLILGFSALEV